MDAPPPVRYVRTSDGFDIAYAVTGEGAPLVMMWDMPHGCFEVHWNPELSRTLLDSLASRFKLIQFDSRGNGNSSRNLADDHKFDDYVLDLETVVDHLGLGSFVLMAPVFAAHITSCYALRHPQRVAGLIYVNPMPPENPWRGMKNWEALYTNEWNLFIDGYTRVFFPDGNPSWSNYVREAVTQSDYLKHAEALAGSSISSLLPRVTAPAIVLGSRDPASQAMAVGMRQFASLLPNARLVLFEGRQNQEIVFSKDARLPPAIPVIEEFTTGLGLDSGQATSAAQEAILSERETEVLRLLACGKSNPQIAKDLFITRNTVQNHLKSVYRKARLQNRAQAAVYAKEHGIV